MAKTFFWPSGGTPNPRSAQKFLLDQNFVFFWQWVTCPPFIFFNNCCFPKFFYTLFGLTIFVFKKGITLLLNIIGASKLTKNMASSLSKNQNSAPQNIFCHFYWRKYFFCPKFCFVVNFEAPSVFNSKVIYFLKTEMIKPNKAWKNFEKQQLLKK